MPNDYGHKEAYTGVMQACDYWWRSQHGGDVMPEQLRVGIAGAIFLLTDIAISLNEIATAIDAVDSVEDGGGIETTPSLSKSERNT